jgi:hypothetical protein
MNFINGYNFYCYLFFIFILFFSTFFIEELNCVKLNMGERMKTNSSTNMNMGMRRKYDVLVNDDFNNIADGN